MKKKRKKMPKIGIYRKWLRFIISIKEGIERDYQFPEDLLRHDTEEKIVFYAPRSGILHGAIYLKKPLALVMIINKRKRQFHFAQFLNEEAHFFGHCLQLQYSPPGTVSQEEATDELMAFMEERIPPDLLDMLLKANFPELAE